MGANLPFDDKLTGQVLLQISSPLNQDGIKVYFQFPLLINSDSKGGKWEEVQTRLAEPFAFYNGGTPREISLKWIYIVSGQAQGYDGKVWSANFIAKLVKSIRSYFYNEAGAGLIIQFQAYDVAGSGSDAASKFWTFRTEKVSVDYSGPIIGDGTGYFPLKTELSMTLKFLTTGSGSESGDGDEPNDKDKKVKINGLMDLPTATNNVNWY